MWGVAITLSSFSMEYLEGADGGSEYQVSIAAYEIRRSTKAWYRASSSTTAARDTITIEAVLFIRANSPFPIRPRVSDVSGSATVRVTPAALIESGGIFSIPAPRHWTSLSLGANSKRPQMVVSRVALVPTNTSQSARSPLSPAPDSLGEDETNSHLVSSFWLRISAALSGVTP